MVVSVVFVSQILCCFTTITVLKLLKSERGGFYTLIKKKTPRPDGTKPFSLFEEGKFVLITSSILIFS